MLAGIAKCGHSECGNALTIATGKGGRYRYYRCSRRLRRGETVCEGVSIRDNALETIFVDALDQRLLLPERLKTLLSNMLDRSETVTQVLCDRAGASHRADQRRWQDQEHDRLHRVGRSDT